MANIILPRKWTQQPQYPVEIDWSNPLAPEMGGVWGPDRNLITGKEVSAGGTGSDPVSRFIQSGRALYTNGKWIQTDVPASSFSVLTFLAILVPDAAPSSANFCSFLQTGQLTLNWNHSNSAYQGSMTIYNGGAYPTCKFTGGFTPREQVIIAGTYDGTNLRVYRDGVLENTVAAANSLSGVAINSLQFLGGTGGTASFAGACSLFYWDTGKARSGSEIKSISENPWQILKRRSRRIWVGGVAGGDVTLPLGFVTEADSANSITSAKSRAIGQVSESDSAIGIGASKSVTLGLTVEANQAHAIARAKSAGLGITTETDTSFALSRSKLSTIGQPTEADSANAVARSKTVTLGIVVETDSAPSLGAGISVAIGQVVESDTAQAISKTKSKALSQVVESDSVPPIAATKTLALGLVTEVDTPLPLAQASGITIGHVTESDTAPAISITKVKVLGQVTEANTVSGITKVKSTTIGQVIEADTANPLVGNLVAVLGLVTEVEFAHSISLLKSRGLLQVTEVDSVFGLTKDKVVYISQVVEVDQVFSVFSKIDYRFVESGYNTLSIAPCYNKVYIDPNYH